MKEKLHIHDIPFDKAKPVSDVKLIWEVGGSSILLSMVDVSINEFGVPLPFDPDFLPHPANVKAHIENARGMAFISGSPSFYDLNTVFVYNRPEITKLKCFHK